MTIPVPPIQPGPGVVPPFAAPPREGNRRRLWTGLGIGAAVAVLCCGGGTAGIVTLVKTSEDAAKNEARAVVTKFMTAWEKQDFAGAYQLVCDDVRQQVGLPQFADTLGQQQVEEFQVGTPNFNSATEIEVPVSIQSTDGLPHDLTLGVVVDSSTNESQVCDGITG